MRNLSKSTILVWCFLVLPLLILPLLPGTGAGAPAAALLLKEAVYNAAGLAACELYEYIDYDSWYSSQLLHEMSVTDPGYKIVRRRVVSLLGCWVNVKMSAELLPSLYEALLLALHPREDIVVGCLGGAYFGSCLIWCAFHACLYMQIRLTAASSLRQGEWPFCLAAGHVIVHVSSGVLCTCIVDVFVFAQSY